MVVVLVVLVALVAVAMVLVVLVALLLLGKAMLVALEEDLLVVAVAVALVP
jgi:hypothetical protein